MEGAATHLQVLREEGPQLCLQQLSVGGGETRVRAGGRGRGAEEGGRVSPPAQQALSSLGLENGRRCPTAGQVSPRWLCPPALPAADSEASTGPGRREGLRLRGRGLRSSGPRGPGRRQRGPHRLWLGTRPTAPRQPAEPADSRCSLRKAQSTRGGRPRRLRASAPALSDSTGRPTGPWGPLLPGL